MGSKGRITHKIAHEALQSALSAGIPAVIDWQDIERADKMARRASGLDSDDAPKVNVNLNLVNQRILAMQQAPD
jgi:hypothetical protein